MTNDPSDLFQLIATELSDPARLMELMQAPPAERPAVEAVPYVAPRTGTEVRLAALWADLLRIERVGAEDNFFTLGGHSLLGTQMLSRVAGATGVELPLRALFDAPTVAGLARQIDTAPAAVHRQNLARTSRDTAPLSSSQQRLWLVQQLAPDDPSYTIPVAFRVRGPLDEAALERALTEIVRRHEVLRTTFAVVDGSPVQRVGPVPAEILTRADVASETEARDAMAAELRRPFDLETGPVFRARLWRTGPDERLLLFAVHHIAFDGWSAGVLLRELAALYRGSTLPEPRLQYADYAAWQREWMESDEMRAQLDFWRGRLGGAEPEALELPADRPRPAVRTYRGSRERVLLPAALIGRLRRLARFDGETEGATLFMVLLAGFQALLHRYTGRDDLWVGTPVANRSRLETEDLLGFFVNTLVLRTDLSGDPGFRTFLSRVREVTLAAYDHQDLPLDRLVEELRPERSLGYQPLFQVLFALQNTPRAVLDPSGLELEPLPVHNGTSRFDLVVSLEEGEAGLTAVIESSADLFDRPTVLRLAGHLAAVLESAAADPDRPLSGMGLMTGVERHQALVEWNDSAAEYPREMLIHELLEAQAARTPDIPALVLHGEAWTYAGLNRRANRIAHHLRRLGAAPEARVAILVERSFDVVAAIFGVLKSGAAYVPLDPSYPAERLAFILEDSRPVALVTRASLVRDLPLPDGLRVVDVDAVEGSEEDPERVAVPENLAYAIYTSGSTGRPKGVLVPHRGVVSLAAMMADVFGLGPGSRILQLFSFGFDASMWDLLMALPVGGTLHVAPEEVRLPGAPLERLLREERIEVVTLPPSLLSVLPAAELPDVRIVTATGEACSAEVVAQWAPGRRFYNGYGPTETTVGTTMGLCTGDERVPSIGRPFTNTRVYLVDRDGMPVPVGVPGELLAGGDGVVRGYLGQPALTAQRFVPDPFGEPGGRLYRTGDLARYRPDGRLEFLGRVDHQVKIRGFRVELEEIESRLARHPEVGDAVVVAREDGGSRRLVAYVKPTGSAETGSLRAWLKESLPDFMIPSAFVLVDDFPRLPNGKVDRRLLARTAPLPEARSERDVAAPRTRAEEILVRVWSEVLGAARVGIHDNFFELGGDSILSIQVVSRAQRAGLKLSPRQVFLHQTVSELAAVAVQDTGAGDDGPVTGPVTPLPIQRWFFEQDLPAPHHWNHAVMLAAQRPVDLSRLRAACAALHERHDALRLRVADGRMWIAGPEEPLPFTVVEGGPLSDAAAQVQASLDLDAGPIVRFVLFLDGDSPARLLIVVHHLAVDGVSWRILLADLHAAYDGLELAPRGTSVQAWAAKLAEHAPALLDELPFWAERPAVPPLPVDLPGRNAANTEGSAETVRVSLTQDETRPLLQDDTQAALLAALVRAFAPWTGEDRLLVDLEAHGREEELFEGVDLTRTVGWFTSLHPVLLLDARRAPRHGLGYGLLRYLAGGEASARLAVLPRAEVSFNYLGQFDHVVPGSPLFLLASDPAGPLRDPRGLRSHRIDVNVSVSGGCLHASFTYSRNVHRRETIEALAGRFAEALRSGEHQVVPAYSVADFPRVRMSQEELDDILDDLVDPDEDFA